MLQHLLGSLLLAQVLQRCLEVFVLKQLQLCGRHVRERHCHKADELRVVSLKLLALNQSIGVVGRSPGRQVIPMQQSANVQQSRRQPVPQPIQCSSLCNNAT